MKLADQKNDKLRGKTMIKNLLKVVEKLDRSADTMHQVDLRLFSDGSGHIQALDAANCTTAWYADFDDLEALQAIIAAKLVSRNQGAAEQIADLVECGDIPPLDHVLWKHFEHMVANADLSNPDTIRRLYPVVADIVTEKHSRFTHPNL